MALALVQAATGNSNAVTISTPTAGNSGFLIYSCDPQAASPAPSISGFTEILSGTGGGNNLWSFIFVKNSLSGSEGTTLTISRTGTPGNETTTFHEWSGADTAGASDATPTISNQGFIGSGGGKTFPSITTVTNDAIVVAHTRNTGNGNNPNVVTGPSGYTGPMDTSVRDLTGSWYVVKVTAGSETPGTVTLAGNAYFSTICYAVKPAGGAVAASLPPRIPSIAHLIGR